MGDFYHLCRLCLKNSRRYCNIFDCCLMEIINQVYELDICLNDGLPNFVCVQCLSKVKEFLKLKKEAHKGRSALLYLKQKIEASPSIKEEFPESQTDENVSMTFEDMAKNVGGKSFDLSIPGNTIKKESLEIDNETEDEINCVAGFEDDGEEDPMEKKQIMKTSGYSLGVAGGIFTKAVEISETLSTMQVSVKEEPLEKEILESQMPEYSLGAAENIVPVDVEIAVDISAMEFVVKEEPLEVSGRVVCPRMHKNYEFRESNFEAYSCQEYTPDDNAPKRHTPHASSFLKSEPYESLPKQSMTHEFAVPEFVTREYLPKGSLTHQYAQGQSKHQEYEDEESMSEGEEAGENTLKEAESDKQNCEDMQMHGSREVEDRRIQWRVVDIDHPSKMTCEGDCEEERMYSCNICRKTLISYANIAKHVKYAHSEKRPFHCEICGKAFKMKYQLNSHSLMHSEAKPFSCQVCSKSFLYKRNLVVHELVHSGCSRYNCTHCDKKFKRKEDFENHQPLHDEQKVWECAECPESFRRWKDVVEHREAHRRKKGLTCDMCGNKFRIKSELRKHMLKHTLPYQCNVCERNFSLASNLKRHMRSHTGEKPYSCTVCEKRFGIKQHMVTHLHMHTGEKQFRCTVCEKHFSRKEHLARHMNIHTQDRKKPYTART